MMTASPRMTHAPPSMTTARVVTTIYACPGLRSRSIVVTTLAGVMRGGAGVMRGGACVMRGGACVMRGGRHAGGDCKKVTPTPMDKIP